MRGVCVDASDCGVCCVGLSVCVVVVCSRCFSLFYFFFLFLFCFIFLLLLFSLSLFMSISNVKVSNLLTS